MRQETIPTFLLTVLLALGQVSQGLLLPSCYPSSIPPACTRNLSLISPTLPTCSVSVDNLINGRTAPGNSARSSTNPLPPWINYDLALRGQLVAHDSAYSVGLSVLFGVLTELNMPDVRNVLMFTNHSATPTHNVQRDLATIAQGYIWFTDWFTGPPGLFTLQHFVTSIANVRARHINATAQANAKMATDGYLTDPALYMNTPTNDVLWAAFNADLDNSDIPAGLRTPPPSHWTNISALIFNQQAMAFVHYNLLSLPILFSEEFGVAVCDKDLFALNHLLAVVAHSLGVDDQYNMGIQEDLATVQTVYRQIFNQYIIPSLFQFEKKTYVMLDNVLGGVSQFSGGLFSPPLILYRFLKYFVDIDATNLWNLMSDKDKAFNTGVDTSILPQLMSNPIYRTTLSQTFITFLQTEGNLYYPGTFASMYSKSRWAFSPDP